MTAAITSELAWNDYEARAWANAVYERGLLLSNLDEDERIMVVMLGERSRAIMRDVKR